MKNFQKEFIKKIKTKEGGITLIALVITIVVLLILAGVSIATLTGNNGILTRANDAKVETRGASVQEARDLWKTNKKADEKTGTTTAQTLEELVNDLVAQKLLTEDEKDQIIGNETKGIEAQYKVTIGSRTIEFGSAMGQVDVNTVATENSTINGKVATYSNPVIPKGFKAVETTQDSTISAEADWNSSTGYQYGLVIEDVSAGDSTTVGSQFVWVPVQNYEEFHLREGYWNGTLASWLDPAENDNNPSREAGSNSSSPYTPGLPYAENSVQGTAESIAMYESVENYQGFYIARYEAGINGTTVSTETDDANKQTQNGDVKPVSKAGVGVWNYIPWGGTDSNTASDGLPGDDTADGAVKVARSMYNTTNTTAVSTLCYGVQWDAVMKWMENVSNQNVSGKTYIQDSTGMGNYSRTISTTGAYAVNNIYDMAGNMYEWTMEACSAYGRAGRGGSYASGSGIPASNRNSYAPDCSFSFLGFRPALYILQD